MPVQYKLFSKKVFKEEGVVNCVNSAKRLSEMKIGVTLVRVEIYMKDKKKEKTHAAIPFEKFGYKARKEIGQQPEKHLR